MSDTIFFGDGSPPIRDTIVRIERKVDAVTREKGKNPTMSDRYTVKNAQEAFERLAEATGNRPAASWNDVGGWQLDYNSVSNDFLVIEVTDSGGGIREPFGPMRLTPREFCVMVDFAIRVLEVWRTSEQIRGHRS